MKMRLLDQTEVEEVGERALLALKFELHTSTSSDPVSQTGHENEKMDGTRVLAM
jgi:hypothetical protein